MRGCLDLQRNAGASPPTDEEIGAWRAARLCRSQQTHTRPRRAACDPRGPAQCSLGPSQGLELSPPQSARSKTHHRPRVLLRHVPACSVLVTALFPRALIRMALVCTYFPLLCDVGLQTPLWVISHSPANKGTLQLLLAPLHLLAGETPCPRAAVPGPIQAQSNDKCRTAAQPHPRSHPPVICTARDRQQGVRGLPGLPGAVSTIKTSPSSSRT